MTRIAVLDYGMGNLRSVEKALEKVGANAEITSDPAAADAADGVVLPGVGAFPRAMERVRELGIDELVSGRIERGAPVLGICLGMQLLFDDSTENEGDTGLGLLEGAVGPLAANGYKIPHIGWSPVRWEHDSELTDGLGPEPPFYFVHSFVPRPGNDEDVLGNRRIRRALRVRRRAPAALRSPVPSREVELGGPGAARELHAHLRVILYPAIDIRDGHAVRLVQGDYDRETAFDDDPVVAAVRWEQEGATWLHVVDLDGARAGEPRNLDHVRRIVAAVGIPIQLGGGLRDSGKVEEAIRAGVERVVLGTAAVREPDVAEAIASAHGDRVVAAVDARAGKVAAEGWTEPSAISPADLARELAGRGVQRFIYTPVEVDGMMEGPDIESLREVAAATDARGHLLGRRRDPRPPEASSASLGIDNVGGVIVGRALYERRFTVSEGQAALDG